MRTIILYSKPGCHLCEGLQEKLETLPIQIEIRDITQNPEWFQKYQYEVPVMSYFTDDADQTEYLLPRVSPRASASKVAQMIQTHLGPFEA